jgi:hypothetical protein
LSGADSLLEACLLPDLLVDLFGQFLAAAGRICVLLTSPVIGGVIAGTFFDRFLDVPVGACPNRGSLWAPLRAPTGGCAWL